MAVRQACPVKPVIHMIDLRVRVLSRNVLQVWLEGGAGNPYPFIVDIRLRQQARTTCRCVIVYTMCRCVIVCTRRTMAYCSQLVQRTRS